jgi:hypothetical protein
MELFAFGLERWHMTGFSEFLQRSWNQMRALRDAREVCDYALEHCVTLSTEWNDHHNAGELLMGAWGQVAKSDHVDAAEFASRIRLLPNYNDMAQQSFFAQWMEKTFGSSPEPQ